MTGSLNGKGAIRQRLNDESHKCRLQVVLFQRTTLAKALRRGQCCSGSGRPPDTRAFTIHLVLDQKDARPADGETSRLPEAPE